MRAASAEGDGTQQGSRRARGTLDSHRPRSPMLASCGGSAPHDPARIIAGAASPGRSASSCSAAACDEAEARDGGGGGAVMALPPAQSECRVQTARVPGRAGAGSWRCGHGGAHVSRQATARGPSSPVRPCLCSLTPPCWSSSLPQFGHPSAGTSFTRRAARGVHSAPSSTAPC